MSSMSIGSSLQTGVANEKQKKRVAPAAGSVASADGEFAKHGQSLDGDGRDRRLDGHRFAKHAASFEVKLKGSSSSAQYSLSRLVATKPKQRC